MNQYDINKRSFFSIGPHLLGLIFIAVGTFAIVSPLFMPGNNSVAKALSAGTGFVLFGIAVVFSYRGTLFDFTGKRYKDYYSFCGIQIGQWETLPDLKLIKVFPHTFKNVLGSNGINPSAAVKVTRYVMVLYADKHKPEMVFEHDDMHRTLKEAK
ncbi:MAG TPA: hypothetical protein VK750_02670, partial [Cytophagaceae bacterium]|nr:hypothetical protein [Cytophagaceae bacterium]